MIFFGKVFLDFLNFEKKMLGLKKLCRFKKSAHYVLSKRTLFFFIFKVVIILYFIFKHFLNIVMRFYERGWFKIYWFLEIETF